MDSTHVRAVLRSASPALAGGEGGGLHSEGRKETLLSSFHPEAATVATVADVLLAVGIYVLARPKRQELAGELAREGWTGADVRMLADYLRAAVDDAGMAQRQLAGRITRSEGRADTLADLRRRGPSPTSDDTPGAWIRRQNVQKVREAEEAWTQYLDDIATGRVARLPRMPHPWERRRMSAGDEGGAA